MFAIKMIFLGEEEAKQAYLEAFQKVKHMENQPGLLEKAGKIGSAFKTLLDLGSLMASLDPTGGAEVAFSVCTKAWEHLEQQEKQDTELNELVKRLARMIPSVESIKGLANNNLKDTIMDMLNLIEDVSLFILNTRPRGSFERAWRAAISSEIQEQSEAYIAKFEELRREFDSRVGVQALRVAEIERMNAKLGELKPADLASYDPNRKCLAGTRANIIDELTDWVQQPDTAPRLAWVHGLAGLGKSSIATSVCLQLDNQHTLASSFFCRRDSPELRDPRRVLTTIVYGLALRWEAYRDVVVGVIGEDPELHSKHIQPLYDSLVGKPLQNLVGAKRPAGILVVVVDALDECGDIMARRQLLACLRGMLQLGPWLRIIVTSRPDHDIREFFGYVGADWHMEYNVLHYDALADVRILIDDRLGELTQADDWPEDATDKLLLRSNGLFIWAQTACQFILSGFDRNKRLNQVLAGTHISNSSADLDILYTTAVSTSALDGADDNLEYTMKCLGVVVVTATRTPLAIPSLAQLLRGHIPRDILNRVLRSLSSVLYVDQKQDGAVRISHPSFMDYIIDPLRSKKLCVNLEQQNTILAECCLRMMNEGLRFNICGLETSHVLNSQVPNLDGRVRDAIHPHMSYSCLYWSSHVADAQIDALNDCLRPFLFQTPLMYWIEALSLLRKLNTALSSLLQFTGCSVPDSMRDCCVVANDAYRFVLSFYDAISKSTPHLYISALAFAPRNAGIVQRMRPIFSKLLTVLQGAEEWTPCLSCIWVGSEVHSIAVSPNGHRIVSGSEDGTVRVWDAGTGDMVLGPLEGHSIAVSCVAFSPDGRWIASISEDCTICIWNAETGESRLDPLKDDFGLTPSVAFSPDGHRLASSFSNGMIRVWELKTSQSILELHGHSGYVCSIAFSPDGRWIVSGSRDNTLRIWDAQTGASILKPLCGHSDVVLSVAFSPDSHRIISSSMDNTIRIWDVKTGDVLLGPLQAQSEWVRSVAFSADGRRVASGGSSDGRTVCIWDAQTGDLVMEPLDSHSGQVTSVAFCPNGRVVSGSFDKTIRIWDIAVNESGARPFEQPNASKVYIGWVTSVVFLTDGRSIASGSADGTVRIWDVETGQAVREPLRGHTDQVAAVAVSSNGRWIASGSADKTVRFWDVATGSATLEPLRGHTGLVYSVSFSPDCHLIASGSEDETVRIWDVETGQTVLGPLTGHSWWVTSVAFSPSGHQIASGSMDGSVRIWDTKTGQSIVGRPEIEYGNMASVAFSPDGHRVVFGTTNKILSVLDAESGDTILGPLEGHGAWIKSVTFSPDGCWIASASDDKTIRIWDAQTGEPVLEPLQGHTMFVTSVAFSPDGRRIVSSSADASIRIWDTNPGHQLNITTSRYLSGSEAQILSPQKAGGRVLVTSNQLAHRIHGRLGGWVTSTTGELLVWLPQELRQIDDSLLCMPPRRIPHPAVIDFTQFVHGKSWSLVFDT
ncbi:hypothetical protein FRC12_001125 [Ceratobasidium sp. 428]|nr:hypothetical protein FRC12_001125 [Ceratobasidium sp. 428]